VSRARRNPVADLRGVARLAVEATQGVTGIVEDMQGPTLGIAALVHRSIRGVTRRVGQGIDAGLAPLVPLLGETRSPAELEAVLAVLNGVIGDHLEATGNPLAIPMRLRRHGEPLVLERAHLAATLPDAGGRLLVMVHGSCMNDLRWRRNGHEHGAALSRDLGYTALHLHYNSGLHISTSGRDLAAMLERLVQEWPVPVKELALLAHSMGGLVARSACHQGAQAGHHWVRHLGRMIFLGTPHHGAPAERVGAWVNVALGLAPFAGALARLPRIRSAAITDLRHGNLLDEDWEGRDRFHPGPDRRRPVPLPRRVKSFAIAGSTSPRPPPRGRRPRGDGLVPVDSALGQHRAPERDLRIPPSRRWIAWQTGHLDLLDDPEVYVRIRGWLSGR
jgi:hypothetical protein